MKNKLIAVISLFLIVLSFHVDASETDPSDQTTLSYSSYATVGGSGANDSENSGSASTDEFTGSFNFSLPLQVPPGRGGLTPNLSLNYSSHQRSKPSWVGRGWSLDMGVIQRVPYQGFVDYVNGQHFEFMASGAAAPLVLVSEAIDANSKYGLSQTSGLIVDEYQVKIESSFTIYLHLKEESSGSYIDQGWVAIDKSGKTYYYGETDNSKLQKTECDRGDASTCREQTWIKSWALSRIVDPDENELNVDYDGALNLQTIEYLDVQISFVTESGGEWLPEDRESFISLSDKQKRLAEIVIASNGNRLTKYDLNYSQYTEHFLESVQQFGADDSTSLPAYEFEYYKGGEANHGSNRQVSWSTTSYDKTATTSTAQGDENGWINDYTQFIDVNGDALPDKVVSYDETDVINVFYNNGDDFVFIPGKSQWTDPFGDLDCTATDSYCEGKLHAYYNWDSRKQFVFLMDINGDSLPDRIKSVPSLSGSSTQKDFLIALNNGSGWETNTSNFLRWTDPYVGDYPGTTDNEKFFMDMNGDGLVDRVIGTDRAGHESNDGYNVYYNTGTGFNPSPRYWRDPVSVYSLHASGAGVLNGEWGSCGIYSTLRDYNGDGLPDRLYKATTTYNGTNYEGLIVFFNQNGQQWSHNDPSEIEQDIQYGLVKPVSDPAEHCNGYINGVQDWIDLDQDGVLDRMYATSTVPNNFYIDLYPHSSRGSHSGLSDPVSNSGSDYSGNGYIANSHVADVHGSTLSGHNIHTLTIDLNGDGYPDRLTQSPRDGSRNHKVYKFYPMRSAAVEFSDHPSQIRDSMVSQPVGAMKSLRTSTGNEIAVEYMSSGIPTRWSSNFSNMPVTHRYMPFHLFVVKAVYALDTTMTQGLSEPEAIRWPGMRWSTFDYKGGNYFLRLPTSGHDYYKNFNGFQTVQKTLFLGDVASWQDSYTTTIYYQSLGEVYTVDPLDETLFNQNAYDHHALSGKSFFEIAQTDSQVFSTMENNFDVNRLSSGDNYSCTSVCFPQLLSKEKAVYESGASYQRVTLAEYTYDTSTGNLLTEIVKDGSGSELITKENTYYNKSNFQADLQIRNKVERQTKSYNGNILKKKEFTYDQQGNPVTESEFITSSQKLTSTKSYNSNGSLHTHTGHDGITRTYTYDSEGLFPESEIYALPSGDIVTKTMDYDRLTGLPTVLTDQYGVIKINVYDDFGRLTTQSVKNRSGTEYTLIEKTYEDLELTVGSWSDVAVQKISEYEPRPGYSDTQTNPKKISYVSANGLILQECLYSERGNYRVVQKRIYEAGRYDVTTTPEFSSDCTFLSSVSDTQSKTITYKDNRGRVLQEVSPGADSGSPVNEITYSYDINSQYQSIKTATDSNAKTKTFVYDLNDNLVQVIDEAGGELEYTYDAVGNIETVSVNGTPTIELNHNMLGQKTQMVDANLGTITYEYDLFGRLYRQTDNMGQILQFEYDGASRIDTKTIFDGAGATEKIYSYHYDSGDSGYNVLPGELFKVEEADGSGTLLRATKYGYDSEFRRNNKITKNLVGYAELTQTFEYDYLGRTTSTSYPGNQSLYYTYTRNDLVQKSCSVESCDSTGEVYYTINPDEALNNKGALLKLSYGNGVEKQYTYYENSQRLQSFKIYKNETVYSEREYQYDVDDNILSINDTKSSSGTGAISQASYDNLSRLTSFTFQGTTSVQAQTYDAQGNMLTNSLSHGSDVYQYNDSKPHAVTQIGSDHFTYDDNGNMLTDSHRTMVYNAQNQLSQVTMSSGVVIIYQYNFEGQRVSKRVVNSSAGTDVTTYYLGNAIEIKDDNLYFHIYVNQDKVATKSLGALSDFIASASSTLKPGLIHSRQALAYAGPVSSVVLPFLLMLSFRPIDRRKWAIIYHRLIHKQSLTLAEKGLSQCFKWMNSWNNYSQAMREALMAFPHKKTFKVASLILVFCFIAMAPLRYSYASGGSSSVDTYFFYVHGDHLGSTHIMTEGNPLGQVHSGITYNRGDIVQRYEYNPFGTEKYVLNSGLATDPSFTGQKYDVDSGLYYYQARYYNPDLGRFIQADTVIPESTDLQAYNRYSYVRNNPLKYTDPSGHSWWKKVLGGLAVIAGIAIMAIAMVIEIPILATLGLALTAYGASLMGAQTESVGASVTVGGDGSVSGGGWTSSSGRSQHVDLTSTRTMSSGLSSGSSGFVRYSIGYMGDPTIYNEKRGSGVSGSWEPEYNFWGATHQKMNNAVNYVAAGLSKMGMTRLGNNLKFYFEKASGRVFYGNQYVKTLNLRAVGKAAGRATLLISLVLASVEVYDAYQQEGKFGVQSQRTLSKNIGGIIFTSLGVHYGAVIGGIAAGGKTASPKALAIGSAAGAIGFGILGNAAGEVLGTAAYDNFIR